MGCASAPSSRSSPSAGSSSGSSSGPWSGCRCLRTGHDDVTRSILVVGPRDRRPPARLGYAGRVLGTWSNITRASAPPGQRRRRPRRGGGRRRRAALGLAGGGRHRLAQQPLHLARRRGAPLRHPALDRPDPSPGALDLQRPADVLEQPGLPPGVLARSRRPRRRPSRRRPMRRPRALADPAVFSTVKVLGTACGNEQEGSGFVVGPGLVATNAHVVAGESNGNTQVLVGQQRVQRDRPCYFDPVLRPRRPAHRRAARTGAQHQPEPGRARDPGRAPRLPRGRAAHHRPGRA